jgi:hypothetical protein
MRHHSGAATSFRITRYAVQLFTNSLSWSRCADLSRDTLSHYATHCFCICFVKQNPAQIIRRVLQFYAFFPVAECKDMNFNSFKSNYLSLAPFSGKMWLRLHCNQTIVSNKSAKRSRKNKLPVERGSFTPILIRRLQAELPECDEWV